MQQRIQIKLRSLLDKLLVPFIGEVPHPILTKSSQGKLMEKKPLTLPNKLVTCAYR